MLFFFTFCEKNWSIGFIYLKSVNLQYNTQNQWDKWLVNQVSDVPSVIFFIKTCKILCQNPFNSFIIFFFHKIKSFEWPKSMKSNEKKILGTSDAWSMSHLSHRPSKPLYYVYCRLVVQIVYKRHRFYCLTSKATQHLVTYILRFLH